MTRPADIEITEVSDERSPLADAALSLFATTFEPYEQHQVADLRSEIAEKRLGLLAPFDFHLLVARRGEALLGAIIGVYLAGVNAGFVSYLAVLDSARGTGVGRWLRAQLIDQLQSDARRAGQDDVAWVLGEVRATNPWLHRLVRDRGAIPFDLTYYHPGMFPERNPAAYVLYRQPISDPRVELPADLVRQIIYAVYRRAYRVRYPLQHPGFAAMLEQMGDRAVIGVHPEFR